MAEHKHEILPVDCRCSAETIHVRSEKAETKGETYCSTFCPRGCC